VRRRRQSWTVVEGARGGAVRDRGPARSACRSSRGRLYRASEVAALKDAGIEYAEVEQAYAGYVYGDSTCGQRAVYELGLTGIPVFNVNNNCSTGSTALMLGKQAIEGGIAECVLAVGFEKMEKGALGSKFNDRTNPLEHHVNVMNEVQGFTARRPRRRCSAAPGASTAGSTAPRRRPSRRSARRRASTRRRTRTRSSRPAAHGRRDPRVDEVFDPLTRYQCCPPTCGAAAAVLCSDEFAKKHGITKPVYIAARP
jgi:sterol carrier protein 2